MGKLNDVGAAAGRMLRTLSRQTKRRLAQSDALVQRTKAEAATRRGMMDAALRERQAKRGK